MKFIIALVFLIIASSGCDHSIQLDSKYQISYLKPHFYAAVLGPNQIVEIDFDVVQYAVHEQFLVGYANAITNSNTTAQTLWVSKGGWFILNMESGEKWEYLSVHDFRQLWKKCSQRPLNEVRFTRTIRFNE